nr:MAG TPA: hypothetical protein [Bacteriophage sp.]
MLKVLIEPDSSVPKVALMLIASNLLFKILYIL